MIMADEIKTDLEGASKEVTPTTPRAGGPLPAPAVVLPVPPVQPVVPSVPVPAQSAASALASAQPVIQPPVSTPSPEPKTLSHQNDFDKILKDIRIPEHRDVRTSGDTPI